jgi:pilus assembly protein CpaC
MGTTPAPRSAGWLRWGVLLVCWLGMSAPRGADAQSLIQPPPPFAGNLPGVAPPPIALPPKIELPTIPQPQPNKAPGVVGTAVIEQGAPPAAKEPARGEPGRLLPSEQLPPPRPLAGPAGLPLRQPALGTNPGVMGGTPVPTKKDLEEISRFVKEVVDPRSTLDLIQGRARLVILKETPKRVQIANEDTAVFNLVTPKEITLIGKAVGVTVLNLWFADPNDNTKDKVLSYMVRVLPDPETKLRLEATYKALEVEINKSFPDSVVHLKLVGDKVLVTGQARDIADATNIMKLVRANADEKHKHDGDKIAPANFPGQAPRIDDPTNPLATPGLDSYQSFGSSNVINMLRIPGEQQVMLKVTVAEVNRQAARSIGLNFSINNNSGLRVFESRVGNIAGIGGGLNFGLGTGAVNQAVNNVTGLVNNNLPVSLDNGQINLAINALRTLNYAKSLAEPNLVALNGQTATFQAGGQFPVPVTTGYTSGGLQGVNFIPFGVQLNFTPYITDKDRIRLNVAASVSARDITSGTSIGGGFVSGLNTRTFQTTVELREGQTLAVAGLIQNNMGTDASRIPFLGDLPILGRFGSFDRTSAGEQELVVLITPELVHPMDAKEVPPLPGSDLFEPSDVEFYLLGRLESRRSYDYRSPVMNDIGRMSRYHRCEQLYIFGPSGFQYGPSGLPTQP